MTICFSMRILIGRLGSTKEGVGETSGQAPDRGFEEFAPRTSFRQKKQVFMVRCGSRGPQLHRPSRPSVKSVPDVFADALVPGTLVPGTPSFSERPVPGTRSFPPARGGRSLYGRRQEASDHGSVFFPSRRCGVAEVVC